MLPLMMHFDLLFFVTSIKNPTESLDIYRQGRHFTLNLFIILCTANCVRLFYFNRFPCIWNSLPVISFDQSSIKRKLKSSSGVVLYLSLTLIIHVYIFHVLALSVLLCQLALITWFLCCANLVCKLFGVLK